MFQYRILLRRHQKNNAMKKYLALNALLFLSAHLFGQNYVDIVKLYGSTTPVNHFEKSKEGTRLKELGLDLTLPVVINPSDAALAGVIYERIQVELFESGTAQTISSIAIKIGLSKKHSEKWSGTYILLPKTASDFNRFTGKDFQFGGIALMKYTKREDLNYKLGVYYNSELFGPFVVPLVGLYRLSTNKKIEVNLTLPFLADINYKLHNRWNVGINFSGQIRSYHLSITNSNSIGGYVVKSTNELSSYLKFNLSRGLSIQTRIGYSLGRSYRVYDEADKIKFGSVLLKVGDDRYQLNTDFSDGLVFQTILLYRFTRGN